VAEVPRRTGCPPPTKMTLSSADAHSANGLRADQHYGQGEKDHRMVGTHVQTKKPLGLYDKKRTCVSVGRGGPARWLLVRTRG